MRPEAFSMKLASSLLSTSACLLICIASSVRCRISPDSSRPSSIVLLKDAEAVAIAQLICDGHGNNVSSAAIDTEAHQIPISHTASTAGTELQIPCQLSPGVCSRFYKSVITGLAGYFDELDLLTLQLCLPVGSIVMIETDGDVQRAEGPQEHDLPGDGTNDSKPHSDSAKENLSNAPSMPEQHEANEQQQQQRLKSAARSPNDEKITEALKIASTAVLDDNKHLLLQNDEHSIPIGCSSPTSGLFQNGTTCSQEASSGNLMTTDKAVLVNLEEQYSMNARAEDAAFTGDTDEEELMPDGSSIVQRMSTSGGSFGPDWQMGGFVVSGEEMVRRIISVTEGFSLADVKVQQYDDTASDLEDGVLWNLDRLDQRSLPLDKSFHLHGQSCSGVSTSGESLPASRMEAQRPEYQVPVYVLDSGVMSDHNEFRMAEPHEDHHQTLIKSRVHHGYDFVDDDEDASDCNGHGSHVASTVAGRSVGIAKGAHVVSVRVLDCSGNGKIRNVIAGLEWVAENHGRDGNSGPAVVTLSLGVPLGSWSGPLERAIRTVVSSFNITVIVASGNSRTDSCSISPAHLSEVITVGASKLVDAGRSRFPSGHSGDQLWEGTYTYGNYGPCIDLFAPGVNIFGACGGAGRCDEVTRDSYTLASGTSMAVPHVAGVAALYLSQHPRATPRQVKEAILAGATPDVFDMSLAPLIHGTPNLMLYAPVAGCSGDDGPLQ